MELKRAKVALLLLPASTKRRLIWVCPSINLPPRFKNASISSSCRYGAIQLSCTTLRVRSHRTGNSFTSMMRTPLAHWATRCARSDPAASEGDRHMSLPGAGATDQDGVTLLGEESTAGEVAHQGFVDRRAIELEVVEVLGERQLGNGELVLDRTRLLLVDFGGK